MATAKELSELTLEDLDRRAAELRDQLFQDQLKRKTGSLDSPAARTTKRRDLARILTVRTQKQRAAQAAQTAASPAAGEQK